MLTRRRNLPVGFMASLTAAALLIPDAASAQRSGVRSGVIGSAPTDSAPTDSAQSGVIGGSYRGAPIGRRERRGWVYPYSNPCIAWTGRLWVRVC
jgi:hypothetical protein